VRRVLIENDVPKKASRVAEQEYAREAKGAVTLRLLFGVTLSGAMQYIFWPAVVLIVGLVFLFTFKKPLERLLDRTKKIGTTGLDASAATAQETSIERTPSAAEELLGRFDQAMLRIREDGIRQELNNSRIENPVERERILIRHLAAAQTYAAFLQAYRAIFGSQLQMLQALNSMGTAHKDQLRTHYDIAAIMESDFYASYSYDQWLHFLQSHYLVQIEGDAVTISIAGRDFLMFIVREGLTMNKIG
jgi:hypothetical protein